MPPGPSDSLILNLSTENVPRQMLTPATSYHGSEPASSITSSSLSAVSLDEANECLLTFRSQYLIHFPFMIIPSATDADELRQKSPFLWLAIMAIASKSAAKQAALSNELRKTLALSILLDGERNLDLLLCTLTTVAWGHYFTCKKPIVTSLLQLAVGMSGDLGLNRPPLKESTFVLLEYNIRGCPKDCSHLRTMEERRTAVTCFLLNSVVASYFSRIECLRWTPYLDECVRLLSENSEVPTDRLLVQFLRLQMISNKVTQNPGQEGFVEPGGPLKEPWAFYLNALQAQLKECKQNVPPELEQNGIVIITPKLFVLFLHLFQGYGGCICIVQSSM